MLSDSKKLKAVKSPKKRVNDTTRWYSDSQKLDAVKLWMLTGNLVHTATALNLPFPTVQSWRYSDWWAKLVEDLKTEDNIQLTQRLRGIAEKSLQVMEDRLSNGDWILNKSTGTLERKPVSLRDTTQTFNSLHDRQHRLLNKPKEEQNNKQVVDRLAALAAKFEEIAAKKQPIQVTDVLYVESGRVDKEPTEQFPEPTPSKSVVGRSPVPPDTVEGRVHETPEQTQYV